MQPTRVVLTLQFVLCLATGVLQAQEPPTAEDLGKMMEQAKQFTEPSQQHKILERFIGSWDTEIRLIMGPQTTPTEKGTSETSWLMKGRWIKSDSKGTLMGRPMQSFMLMGYDNFKKSFVGTYVSNMDTAMLRSEGDLTQDGKVMLAYGQMDEYLTGEHDKMVKYVWRFVSKDKILFEIHDLPIGEQNTKVIEMTYTRKK